MKFFTSDWYTGELPLDEEEKVVPAYWEYMRRISYRLPKACQRLVEEINLHDGLIRQIIYDVKRKELKIDLRCGDLEVGYFDLDLTYFDISLQPSAIQELAELSQNTETELLYDELDLEGNNRFVHRILFRPGYKEISINFVDLRFTKIDKPDREIPEEPERFKLIQ